MSSLYCRNAVRRTGVNVERALVNLAWIVVPVAMFAFLVLGLWYRQRSPFWLPVAATVALSVTAACSAALLPNADGFRDGHALILVWSLVALTVLATASVAVGRGWPSRGALVVTGLVLPAPLMAFLLAVTVAFLGSN